MPEAPTSYPLPPAWSAAARKAAAAEIDAEQLADAAEALFACDLADRHREVLANLVNTHSDVVKTLRVREARRVFRAARTEGASIRVASERAAEAAGVHPQTVFQDWRLGW